LCAARDLVLGGEERIERTVERLLSVLEPGPDLKVDYAEVRDAATLEEIDLASRRRPGGILIAVACFVGGARLIDSVVIPPLDPT
jgi:pantothenate synthetase